MVWLMAALVVLTGAGLGIWWWLFRAGLPRVRGTLKGPGLGAPVEIIRDKWGIPHIYAQSLADATYGLGYVHAQDRLWQMELRRRMAAGRLSEVIGAVTLEADRFVRRIGLRRAAEAEAAQLDPQEQALAEAYNRGVNAAIAHMGRRLPLEFRLLGVRPAPWTTADTLAWLKVMALNLSLNWEQELFRHRLVEQVGPELAARLEPHYPAGQPLATAPGGEGAADSAEQLLKLFDAAKPYLTMGAPGASNNWVVAGSRTETGKPMLANDPHLILQIPSLWYEAHLICPEASVTGCTLPGSPGVLIGHNQHVGWGFTNSGADVADLFIEKWHPTEAACEFQGQWEPVAVLHETIKVKGEADAVETIYVTRHGPVMAGGPLGTGPALALRWAALDPGHAIRTMMAMNTAGGAAELREALRHWPTPSQNVVFADTAGNIGYVMAGLVPVRKNGTGLTPVPGWTGDYEWTGWIPFEELPQLWNPECGYIVTANNAVVDCSYQHHISWDWSAGYRAQRILDMIAARPKLTLQDFRDIQMDVYSLPGLEFADHCQNLRPTDPLQQQALQALLEWDGHLRPDSIGGAIYETTVHHALHRAYSPLLGQDLLEQWLGKGHTPAPAGAGVGRSTTIATLLRELRFRDTTFLAGGRPLAVVAAAKAPAPVLAGGEAAACDNPWDDLLAASLADAVAYLRHTLGDRPQDWQWGKIHRLQISHPMSAVKPMHLIFGGVDLPVGGDADTPHQSAYVSHRPFMAAGWAPSYRHLLDFADLNRSKSVHPGGQSGQPGSKHYMDLFPLWYKGEYHPMLFTRTAVLEHAQSTLRLQP